MRFTTGFACDDCGRFIQKGTLEYFMTEGHSSIWMALHNRGVNGEISDELSELMEKLDCKEYLGTLNETQAQELMDYTYEILNMNKVSDDEATITLK